MSAPAKVREAAARLKRWLLHDALPIWREQGADPAGGYFDRLNLDGTVAATPKRLRVQARQAYVYAVAPRLGWDGPAEAASRHGLVQVMAHKCDDGLFRPTPDAVAPLDGMGLLYDQAFVLLALASNAAAFGEHGQAKHAAALVDSFAACGHPLGGFSEAPGLAAPLFANANMHLFECFQAWSRASNDPRWRALATAQAQFAQARLIDPATGAIGERFAADWRAASAAADRFVWPGHLYEWAFLLLDWPHANAASRAAAFRLIEIAEAKGVEQGVVIFALDEALAPLDRGARLWAQTERLRACARAAALKDDGSMWDATLEAIGALEAFLDVPTAGLWRDWMRAGGGFVEEPAPASSLYHIVGAIAELDRVTAGAA